MSTNPRDFVHALLASLSTTSKAERERRRERRHEREDIRAQSNLNRRPERQSEISLPSESTNILLTLHVLFPHVLLDALDLLDRGNVVKVSVQNDQHLKSSVLDDDEELTEDKQSFQDRQKRSHQDLHHTTYYVLSTRAARDRTRSSKDGGRSFASSQLNPDQANKHGKGTEELLEDTDKYHVHVAAWNCSCPAFAFAAYSTPTTAPGDDLQSSGLSLHHQSTAEANTEEEIARPAPPICKHLMACLLCDVAPELFGPFGGKAAEQEDGDTAAHETTGIELGELGKIDTRRGAKQVAIGVLAAAGLAAGV